MTYRLKLLFITCTITKVSHMTGYFTFHLLFLFSIVLMTHDPEYALSQYSIVRVLIVLLCGLSIVRPHPLFLLPIVLVTPLSS